MASKDDDLTSSHDSHSVADTSDIVTSNATPSKPSQSSISNRSRDRDDSERSPNAATKPQSSAPPTRRKATMENGVRPASISGPAPPLPKGPPGLSGATQSVPQPRTAPVVLPPIRYSAAAAAAVAPPTTQSSAPPASAPAPTSVTPVSAPITAQPLASAASAASGIKIVPANSSVHPPTAQSSTSSASALSQVQAEAKPSVQPQPLQASPEVAAMSPAPSVKPVDASPSLSSASLPSSASQSQALRGMLSPALSSAASARLPTPPLPVLQQSVAQQLNKQQSPVASERSIASGDVLRSAVHQSALPPQQQIQNMGSAAAQTLPAMSQTASAQLPVSSGASNSSEPPRLPNSLADLVTTFESVKQKCELRDHVQRCLS